MPKIGPASGMSGYHKSPLLESNPGLKDIPHIQRIAPWKFAESDQFSWSNAIEPNLVNPATSGNSTIQYGDGLQSWSPTERTKFKLDPPDTDDQAVAFVPLI